MLVVLGMIIAVASMALPSIIRALEANADAQAYNLVMAQLRAARGISIRDGVYSCVHIQKVDPDVSYPDGSTTVYPNRSARNTFYSGVMARTGAGKFRLAGGYVPRRIPGGIAFGEVNDRTVASGVYTGDEAAETGVCDEDDFTTVSVCFSPRGAMTRQPDGKDVSFDWTDEVFSNPGVKSGDAKQIWRFTVANENTDGDIQLGEPGAEAITLFDYPEYVRLKRDAGQDDGDDCVMFLTETGQFLPINIQTGLMVERR